jgi:hypothetical protein
LRGVSAAPSAAVAIRIPEREWRYVPIAGASLLAGSAIAISRFSMIASSVVGE